MLFSGKIDLFLSLIDCSFFSFIGNKMSLLDTSQEKPHEKIALKALDDPPTSIAESRRHYQS